MIKTSQKTSKCSTDFSTRSLVSVDQVVTRQIDRGMMDRIDEVGLHHGVVGVLYRIGRVDHINLKRREALLVNLSFQTGLFEVSVIHKNDGDVLSGVFLPQP